MRQFLRILRLSLILILVGPPSEILAATTEATAPTEKTDAEEEEVIPLSQKQPVHVKLNHSVPRWGLAPALGITSLTGPLNGFEMLPAMSGGARITYDLLPYVALGYQAQLDLIHFSQDETTRPNTLDITRLTHLLVLEFNTDTGFYVSPLFGISQITFNHRPHGGLSHREPKGTDNVWTWGASGGFTYSTNEKKTFGLGPRLDYLRYRASSRHWIHSHSTISLSFLLKFMF